MKRLLKKANSALLALALCCVMLAGCDTSAILGDAAQQGGQVSHATITSIRTTPASLM